MYINDRLFQKKNKGLRPIPGIMLQHCSDLDPKKAFWSLQIISVTTSKIYEFPQRTIILPDREPFTHDCFVMEMQQNII